MIFSENPDRLFSGPCSGLTGGLNSDTRRKPQERDGRHQSPTKR
jgi:hypothetical protein